MYKVSINDKAVDIRLTFEGYQTVKSCIAALRYAYPDLDVQINETKILK